MLEHTLKQVMLEASVVNYSLQLCRGEGLRYGVLLAVEHPNGQLQGEGRGEEGRGEEGTGGEGKGGEGRGGEGRGRVGKGGERRGRAGRGRAGRGREGEDQLDSCRGTTHEADALLPNLSQDSAVHS